MHLWRSGYGPFIRWAQRDFCQRLIVVPLSTFHRLAELIGDPKGELIFLYMTFDAVRLYSHRLSAESYT